MQPIQRIDSIATTHEPVGERRPEQRRDDGARMMISPPIVGVPRLLWWLAGPSARMTCPTLRARSRAMTGGPDDEREQQRRHGGARGAKADVVEEIEDDVRLAERREPVIEHLASAWGGRAARERRKYTFERHARGMP